MKERVLELLEELVGAHTHNQKRAKADEIAAIVKTAVFPADQVDEPPTLVGDPSAPVENASAFENPAADHHED